jgi:hypothetical protein
MQFIINVHPDKAADLVPKVEAELDRLGFAKPIPNGKNCYDSYEPDIECLMGFANDFRAIGMKSKEFEDHMKSFIKGLAPDGKYTRFQNVTML